MTTSFTFLDPRHPVWVEVQAGWQGINSCYKEKTLLDGLLYPQAVWSLGQMHCWPFFANSRHPLHSQTLIYELQLVYLYLVAEVEREWSKPISVWRKTLLVIVWLFSVAIWFQCKSIPIEPKCWQLFPSCGHWHWQTIREIKMIEMTIVEMTMIEITMIEMTMIEMTMILVTW